MNRRANLDVFTFVIVSFIAIVVFIVLGVVFTQFKDTIVPELQFTGEAQTIATAGSDTVVKSSDTLIFSMILAFFLFIIVSSYLVDISPFFAILGALLWVVSLLLGSVFGNVMENFATSSAEFVTATDAMPKTMWLINHWTPVVVVVGLVALVVAYGKYRGGV